MLEAYSRAQAGYQHIAAMVEDAGWFATLARIANMHAARASETATRLG